MGIFGKPEQKAAEPHARPSSSSSSSPPPAPAKTAATACVVGPKTQLKGEITGAETVVVEGLVEGTVRITGDLRVALGGTVKATVAAQTVVVAGELVGDCHATQRVEIEASGKVTGNIRAPRVVIVEGATFRGNSDMSPRRDGEQA